MEKVKKGDRVRILPEYQDEGDNNFVWVALYDEEKGKVDIMPIDIGLHIKPIYTLEREWVTLA